MFNHLKTALEDRYIIERELGQGGMSVVFLASDLKHSRQVAIKVLRPEIAAVIGVERFLREIHIAAQLNHPHILPLHDSGGVDDLVYYVMPFIEGESLRTKLDHEGHLTLEDTLRIFQQVSSALEYAHKQGVIHRDIKPENILFQDGEALIADFGIALALGEAGSDRLTQTGLMIGTAEYMSPEQAGGQKQIGPATDIYSLGSVLYEMLAGVPPHQGETHQAIIAKILTESPSPIRDIQSGIPTRFERVVKQALSPNIDDRFRSMEQFQSALHDASVRSGLIITDKSKRSRRRMNVAVIAVLITAGVLSTLFGAIRTKQRTEWMHQELARVERLSENGLYHMAYESALELERRNLGGQALARLWPEFADWKSIRTNPAGAAVYRQSTSLEGAEWEFLGLTPVDSVRTLRGEFYWLSISLDGYQQREIALSVLPETLILETEDERKDDMVRIPGFEATIYDGGTRRQIPCNDFYIDRYEVTNREFSEFIEIGGYRNRTYWQHQFIEDGQELPWEEAIARFTDKSGEPGPETWELGTYPEGQAQFPVGGISWYEACAFAAYVGKSLPTRQHWLSAAGLRATNHIVSRGANRSGLNALPVGESGSLNAYGTYDMIGNVREWCYNAKGDYRVIMGDDWTGEWSWNTYQGAIPPFERLPTNGMRLVRYNDDLVNLSLVQAPENRPRRDLTDLSPVTDEEFALIRQQFDYSSNLPLEEHVVSRDSTDSWVLEIVEIDAAYGGERERVYLYYPPTGSPPFQVVLYWPGDGYRSAGVTDIEVANEYRGWTTQIKSFLLTGRVVVLPGFKGTLDRFDRQWNQLGSTSESALLDQLICQIRDMQRAIDYVESKADLDIKRLGYFGLSWGAGYAPWALALEPRIKAAVLTVGGVGRAVRALAALDPVNYLPRIKIPVLMLNGEYDTLIDAQQQEVTYQLLGTPEKDKDKKGYPSVHSVPNSDLHREVRDWFNKYFGTPEQGKTSSGKSPGL